MPYQCLIIDDEALARELIATHLEHLDEFVVVAACANALEARTILQQQKIDLLFLDIEMPLLKGTTFFRGLTEKPRVIFTTAFRDYAVEGFDLNAVDYLVKPILFDRFLQAIDKFKSSLGALTDQTPREHIYVQSNRKNIKVLLDEIQYVESLKDYIRIHLRQGTLVVKYGLAAFEQQLDQRFVRVHRSFLVNKDKVTAFTRQDIEIGSIEIPIGDSYKDAVLNSLQ
ncbi:LytR/AlgR family response regulator transcription factor [Flavilitoribacter nigricans]|uniref:DNA-binding response regulator n=1 Tax=Flavilitoribacter nigricans (strain ATCC 23147 / DSM 23189 / NBRC 102662 / NCIMB 1420 / SS-2) TaxID=1122177 RepID=A0A2D0N7F4_FLAN2|nr:response regulator transcription factor [Flavilitoribacter nigricans]PHN04316.1 DNA-binding response regulator [Flavilitoribacter nigricans DSM 23189 = NBRC 102662]